MLKASGEINELRAVLFTGIEAVDKILNLRSSNGNLTVASTGYFSCVVSVVFNGGEDEKVGAKKYNHKFKSIRSKNTYKTVVGCQSHHSFEHCQVDQHSHLFHHFR